MLSNGPWHYRIDEAVHGPVTLPELRAVLAAAGRGDGVILVREGASEDWLRPAEVDGLLDPFAGPIDPDWPNSPTKVFLHLAVAIVAARLGIAGPVVAIAVAYAVLRDRGWARAEAVPLACVVGLAIGLAFVFVVAAVLPVTATAGWIEVPLEVILPLALAVPVVLRRSHAAILALLVLQAGALVADVVAVPASSAASFALHVIVHAVVLAGLARMVRRGHAPGARDREA